MEKAAPVLARHGDIRPMLLEAKVHPGVVKRLDEVDSGPLLVERYAHGLVFAAEGLTDPQRALFVNLVAGTDAAQRAIHVLRAKLDKVAAAKADQQIHAIEVRFWRVIGYALTIEQRASIRKLMPVGYEHPPDVIFHVFQVPGLSAIQAAKFMSLIKEYESEAAADAAAAARLGAAVQNPNLSTAERAALQRRRMETGDRLARLRKRVTEDSYPIYTKEQRMHVDALMPLVTTGDRARNPGELMHGTHARPKQSKRVHELIQALHRQRSANQSRLQQRLKTLQRDDLTDDSPQSKMMQGMHNNTHAQNVLAMERVGHTIVLEVLEPEQVTAWVVGPR